MCAVSNNLEAFLVPTVGSVFKKYCYLLSHSCWLPIKLIQMLYFLHLGVHQHYVIVEKHITWTKIAIVQVKILS